MSSFSPIVITSGTYNGTRPGRYIKSTVAFGDPTNEIRISPGNKTKSGNTTWSVGKVLQHQDVDGKVHTSTMVFSISQSKLCTPTDVDAALTDISELITATTAKEIAQGRS